VDVVSSRWLVRFIGIALLIGLLLLLAHLQSRLVEIQRTRQSTTSTR